MPRGRHRHSPPLHRLLPPSAIAGVSVVCALGPWLFTEPMVLRGLAAAAAATALVGAFVMRRWDTQAGRQVADLTRARASDEWRFEERVAELETDLDESRELRVKLEQRLRAKRAELAGLRNEHAALLRRYATAETERATALEGRRLLEIETTAPPAALPPARAAQDDAVEAVDGVEAAEAEVGTETEADETVAADDAADAGELDETAELDESADAADDTDESEVPEAAADGDEDDEDAAHEADAPAAFSPEGSKLFLRAQAALGKFDPDAVKLAEDTPNVKAAEAAKAAKDDDPAGAEAAAKAVVTETATDAADGDAEPAREDEAEGKSEAAVEHTRAAAPHPNVPTAPVASTTEAAPAAEQSESSPAEPARAPAPAPVSSGSAELVRRPAGPVVRPSGHFTVPTAVAVVPATPPIRRPTAEGGFDFFGTKSEAPSDALADVQNEDLADVVGQEALALHKAEAEAEFKPAGEESRGVGQVIDLTAHDETEQIDLQGLRSAVS
ncbi:hypothetical protein [Streptomyces antibioticus]|uniref:Secreted protein n=1 Tax=Streptomyces antibioticus TaxID=1890 RepID=A0AAE6YA36_STRAT|nr:hypothetical protein [Streptomyces antibioticus]OOQ50441.1 hypothetical protein AFM16_21620 [Streptomyces antibioticus]QIT45866.1 hypothetical protein HCX60_22010 [Streptomyces antibioticus]